MASTAGREHARGRLPIPMPTNVNRHEIGKRTAPRVARRQPILRLMPYFSFSRLEHLVVSQFGKDLVKKTRTLVELLGSLPARPHLVDLKLKVY